jgi:hypothetical protein
MLSDLRESGAIEQDADIVMFLYRDDYYNPDTEKKNIAEVILAKHRAGEVGEVRLNFISQFVRFENRVNDMTASPTEQLIGSKINNETETFFENKPLKEDDGTSF